MKMTFKDRLINILARMRIIKIWWEILPDGTDDNE